MRITHFQLFCFMRTQLVVSQRCYEASLLDRISVISILDMSTSPINVKHCPMASVNVYESDGHTVQESIPDHPFSAPFACPANWTNTGLDPNPLSTPNTGLGAKGFSAPNSLASLLYTFDPSGPGNFSSNVPYTPLVDSRDYSSIHQSDVAFFGSDYAMWINGTQPVSFSNTQGAVLPNISFPFTRLASTTSVDQSTTFVYHQINGTTFAEEQWDASLGVWTATVYITLADS